MKNKFVLSHTLSTKNFLKLSAACLLLVGNVSHASEGEDFCVNEGGSIVNVDNRVEYTQRPDQPIRTFKLCAFGTKAAIGIESFERPFTMATNVYPPNALAQNLAQRAYFYSYAFTTFLRQDYPEISTERCKVSQGTIKIVSFPQGKAFDLCVFKDGSSIDADTLARTTSSPLNFSLSKALRKRAQW